MAKKVMDYGDMQIEVREKRGITFGRVIACLLVVCIIAVGVCCAGFAARNDEGKWFSNSNLSTWHWSDKIPGTVGGDQNGGNVKPGDNTASTVGGSDISDIENKGVTVLKAVLPRTAYAAMGVSEEAESAYTLTAEVSPDYASDKSLDWSDLVFLDSESEWATGKVVTDYVTVTPLADGNSAVLACLQDFGEPIVLTVSSVSNPEVCAKCFINYYQRVKSCEFAFFYDGVEVSANEVDGVYKVDYTGAEKNYTVELRPVYSNYTLTDTYTTTISGALTSTFGYTATSQLNSLAIPAGLSGGDPVMSDNAQSWCKMVSALFGSPYDIEFVSIQRELCLGKTIDVHGHTTVPAYKLSNTEKQHPRCAYYLSLLESDYFSTAAKFELGKVEYNAYTPAVYNYYGATVATYNDFVLAVQRCNNNGVGVVEYSITINGAHSNYTTVLYVGYNDDLKTNVQDIVLSDTNVAF